MLLIFTFTLINYKIIILICFLILRIEKLRIIVFTVFNGNTILGASWHRQHGYKFLGSALSKSQIHFPL